MIGELQNDPLISPLNRMAVSADGVGIPDRADAACGGSRKSTARPKNNLLIMTGNCGVNCADSERQSACDDS